MHYSKNFLLLRSCYIGSSVWGGFSFVKKVYNNKASISLAFLIGIRQTDLMKSMKWVLAKSSSSLKLSYKLLPLPVPVLYFSIDFDIYDLFSGYFYLVFSNGCDTCRLYAGALGFTYSFYYDTNDWF